MNFFISNGFCLSEQWFNLINKNCFALIEKNHNQSFFDETFFRNNFDFEENHFKLLKEFKQMSLFSICLYFLRCTRSCDKKSNYCRACSRVPEIFFLDCNAISDLAVCTYGTYLHMNNFHRVNLDAFLLNIERNLIDDAENNENCQFFQKVDFPQELFTAFSSVFIRMYLNCTIKSLSNLLCQISCFV